MIISKDKYLNKWVVWSRIGSAYFMRYSSKLKKDCINYVKKHEKKIRSNKKVEV